MSAPYTQKQMKGKYISCFISLCGERPALDCVRVGSGEHQGKPYLYNSINEAKEDKYFDEDWDRVIPAEEFFTPDAIKKVEITINE